MVNTYIIKNMQEKLVDITNITKEGAKLSKAVNDFSWLYEFQILRNETFIDIEVGDIALVKLDGIEIFSGVIINVDPTKLSYKVVDYAWYFNQNEEIYQFEDVEASIVVTKLIETFGGSLGKIEPTELMVDKFYFEKTLGSIIKEIINNVKSLQKKEYRFYYRNNKFYFVKSNKDKLSEEKYKSLSYLGAILNNYKYNALDYIKEPKRNQNIEGMRNSVKVYKTSGNEYIQTDTAKSEESIKRYGLMQKLVSFKDNDLHAGTVTAESILKDKNKIKDKVAIEIPTLSQFIYDGEILNLNHPKYKIVGNYEVKQVSYIFGNHKTIFKAEMELEKVE